MQPRWPTEKEFAIRPRVHVGLGTGSLRTGLRPFSSDHNIAYRTRNLLQLDYVPAGVAGGNKKDNAIFDIFPQDNGTPPTGQMSGISASGFGQPSCHGYNTAGNAVDTALAGSLPANR